MRATAHPDPRSIPAHRVWVPRQHGAWAMLAVPLLLGVAASEPDAWQLVLAGAAYSGFLASASAQAWSRARRASVYRPPIIAYTAVFAALAALLVLACASADTQEDASKALAAGVGIAIGGAVLSTWIGAGLAAVRPRR